MYSSVPGLNRVWCLGEVPGDWPGVLVGDALRGGTGGGAVVAIRRVTMGDECGDTRGERLHDLLPSAVSLLGERARACNDDVHVFGSYN